MSSRVPRALGWLVLALVLLPAPDAASAAPARDSAGRLAGFRFAQQRSAAPCSRSFDDERLAKLEGRLVHEELGVGPDGPWGQTRLCLVHIPAEDLYAAALVGIDDLAHFRAVKLEAVQRLQALGLDVCRVSRWYSWGRLYDGLDGDDFGGLPLACAPQLVTADPGAEPYLPVVRESLERVTGLAAEDFGWRPDRLLRVLVATDQQAALGTLSRYFNSSGDDAQHMVANGTSVMKSGSGPQGVFGQVMLVNLVLAETRTAPRIDATVVHEYAHFVQHALSETVPHWFAEGQARLYERRHSAKELTAGELVMVARALREGSAPRLREMVTEQQWAAATRRLGSSVAYGRSAAALAFLVERHGWLATVALLAANRVGSTDDFHRHLQRLAGLDLEGLEQATAAWLLDLPGGTLRVERGTLTAELLLYPDRTQGEALVQGEAEANSCSITIGRQGFFLELGEDQTFTATRRASGDSVELTFAGRVGSGGELSATFRFNDTRTGCDTGPIPLKPRQAS